MQEQLDRGKRHEQELDSFFVKYHKIELPLSLEKMGLGDRVFINRDDPKDVFLVEYKSDESATRTGNLFIETISVDSANKPGWVFTCQAKVIVYYLPLSKKILIFEPDVLRANIDQWRRVYPERATNKGQNKGYKTHGVLLPIEVAENYARKVIDLQQR